MRSAARHLSTTFAVLSLLIPAISAQQPAAAPPPAAPPKADANSPENAGRTALIKSLDDLAATETAARRAEIAKIHTLAQAQARQAHVRATMLRLLGPLPARTPLNPQVLGETQLTGFRIQKIVFESQPKFFVTALLYLPETVPGTKLPAIVVAPGHGATGKASDFAFASLFARNGFAVLSYDPIGQGERLQYPDPTAPGKSLATRPTGEHAEASLQPMLLGESLARYMLWDGMRAVDYLETRPEIDPQRIGAFGCSGGGAMTALLGALDPRIASTGTACYTTSFDTLLPSIGPQDGEQSTPGWIASCLDFPDWIEVAAPRPYAIIATESDMFPFAGAETTEAEARRFYSLWPAPSFPLKVSSFAAGGGPASPAPAPTASPLKVSSFAAGGGPASPGPAPTASPLKVSSFAAGGGPASPAPAPTAAPLKVSSFAAGGGPASPFPAPTAAPLKVSSFAAGGGPASPAPAPTAAPQLAFIHGPGGHGNLRPIQPQILQFFIDHLHPPTPPGAPTSPPTSPPPAALQVTSTGQVATAYPGAATVYSLNLAHFKALPPPPPLQLRQLQAEIRLLTGAIAIPGARPPQPEARKSNDKPDPCLATFTNSEIDNPAGLGIKRDPPTRLYPGVLILSPHAGNVYCGSGPGQPPDWSRAQSLAEKLHTAMMFNPLPSPAGKEDQKSPILGEFYLLNLRAELAGKTLLGLRVDDVIGAVDRLAAVPETDPGNITAEASGHEALVLLHAAVLDPRLKHITLTNLPPSYREMLANPLPQDIAEDLIPGVLLHYDLPDLIRALGTRVTVVPASNP